MRSKNFITCSVFLYRVKCGPKIVSHVPYYCRVKCGPKISLGNWLALLSANYGMSGLNVAGGKFWDIAVHPPRRTCIYSLSKRSEKQIWGPCVKDIQGWEERQGGSPSLSLCVFILPMWAKWAFSVVVATKGRSSVEVDWHGLSAWLFRHSSPCNRTIHNLNTVHVSGILITSIQSMHKELSQLLCSEPLILSTHQSYSTHNLIHCPHIRTTHNLLHCPHIKTNHNLLHCPHIRTTHSLLHCPHIKTTHNLLHCPHIKTTHNLELLWTLEQQVPSVLLSELWSCSSIWFCVLFVSFTVLTNGAETPNATSNII